MADDGVYEEEVYEEDEQLVCKVYDEDDMFTVLVQLLLAFFALFSLWFKRNSERPKRTFRTWFLDVSKQGVGACYAHVLNMIIASLIISRIRGDNQLDDQCAWYAMCYLIDTTLGLVLAIWGVKIIQILSYKYNWKPLQHSGVYESSNGVVHWDHYVWQVVAWVAVLTVVKLFIYVFMVVASSPLAYAAGILFLPLQSNIRFELLFVMILFPGVLNVIYFWIADSYLKAAADEAGAHEEGEVAVEITEKKESLLTEDDKKEAGAGFDPKAWANPDAKPAAVTNLV